jgi:hypothetical protein
MAEEKILLEKPYDNEADAYRARTLMLERIALALERANELAERRGAVLADALNIAQR